MITADHGNDPTDVSTDHTRERVPILVCGTHINQNLNIGTRSGFADLAATIGDCLGVERHGSGQSFAYEILRNSEHAKLFQTYLWKYFVQQSFRQ